jgi:hypothetical protein
VACGVVVGITGHLRYSRRRPHRLFSELVGEDLGQRLERDAHHTQTSADRESVLFHLVTAAVCQFRNWQGTELDPLGMRAGLNGFSVIDHGSAGAQ